jgi:hypothetical protein
MAEMQLATPGFMDSALTSLQGDASNGGTQEVRVAWQQLSDYNSHTNSVYHYVCAVGNSCDRK